VPEGLVDSNPPRGDQDATCAFAVAMVSPRMPWSSRKERRSNLRVNQPRNPKPNIAQRRHGSAGQAEVMAPSLRHYGGPVHPTARFSSRCLRKHVRHSCLFAATFICAYGQQATGPTAVSQNASVPSAAPPATSPPVSDKRIFGVLPNYRTTDASLQYQRISPKQKMSIAAKDSFDWSLSLVAAGYGGLGQLTDQNPSFGQGAKGYGNRFVRTYADQVIGNFLAEGAVPILLHEDPRYFRLGQGSFWARVGYASSRVFVTRIDSGGTRFNGSEIVGNSLAVGISNAYYPGSRNLGADFQKLTIQVGTDAFTNVLKEFWPDVKRKLPHRRN